MSRSLRSSLPVTQYHIDIVDLEIKGRKSGDFEVKKAFDITDSIGRLQRVDGIIIQHIQKSARVTKMIDGDTMATTEEIREYTNGKVDFMNNSYLEIFIVKRGKSVDADSFSNGAIVPYENKQAIIVEPPYTDEDSIFIHDPDKIKEIMTYEWNSSKKLPSNGLPYLDDIYKDEIFRFKESNVAKHICTITWDYETNDSNVQSVINYVNTMGGKRSSKRNKTRRNLRKG